MKNLKWNLINDAKVSSSDDLIELLLENRGLKRKKDKQEFLYPTSPANLNTEDLGIDKKELDRSINRIRTAIKEKEQIVIYGDYDADGVCATAILWECLYEHSSAVVPHIPDRFIEGYGINVNSLIEIKSKYPGLKLIITVDNGIVAGDAINKASEIGIDVIVTDHHQKGKILPEAFSIIHTDRLSGSGIAWILSRELKRNLKPKTGKGLDLAGLELAAIGTIADQLSLLGPNRSIAHYGLRELAVTKRPGLLELFREAGVQTDNSGAVGTYEINYLIAPRLNAMGRMEQAINSLRLLCTTSRERAKELAQLIGRTNRERQRVVDEVLIHARKITRDKVWEGAIILADEAFHEGVIGLAAGKLVEEFYRPAIVLAKGVEYSKASARSIAGFNIIEVIRKVEYLLEGAGGHPMAAGFKIRTENIDNFLIEFNKAAIPLLSDEVLQKKLKADLELPFPLITSDLVEKLKVFEPTGIGNPAPSFISRGVEVVDSRTVGTEGKHLKLKLKKENRTFDAIAFGRGDEIETLKTGQNIDIIYNVDENIWNGNISLQLKIRDASPSLTT